MKALRKLETIYFPTKKMAKEYSQAVSRESYPSYIFRVRKDDDGKFGFEWVLRIYKVNIPVKKTKKNGSQLQSTDKRLKANRHAKKTKVTRVPATKSPKVEKSKTKVKTKAKKV